MVRIGELIVNGIKNLFHQDDIQLIKSEQKSMIHSMMLLANRTTINQKNIQILENEHEQHSNRWKITAIIEILDNNYNYLEKLETGLGDLFNGQLNH